MTNPTFEILEKALFDFNDTLKLHLIELNENRSLFMNGPSQELIQRSFNISFYQGQKQAIEALQREIKTITDENDLIDSLKNYSQNVEKQLLNVIELNTIANDAQENLTLAQSLDTYYHCKGQHYIISELLLQANKSSL
ncbi:hypothetical protein ACUXIR_001366 [Staphylococcus hominis]